MAPFQLDAGFSLYTTSLSFFDRYPPLIGLFHLVGQRIAALGFVGGVGGWGVGGWGGGGGGGLGGWGGGVCWVGGGVLLGVWLVGMGGCLGGWCVGGGVVRGVGWGVGGGGGGFGWLGRGPPLMGASAWKFLLSCRPYRPSWFHFFASV